MRTRCAHSSSVLLCTPCPSDSAGSVRPCKSTDRANHHQRNTIKPRQGMRSHTPMAAISSDVVCLLSRGATSASSCAIVCLQSHFDFLLFLSPLPLVVPQSSVLCWCAQHRDSEPHYLQPYPTSRNIRVQYGRFDSYVTAVSITSQISIAFPALLFIVWLS